MLSYPPTKYFVLYLPQQFERMLRKNVKKLNSSKKCNVFYKKKCLECSETKNMKKLFCDIFAKVSVKNCFQNFFLLNQSFFSSTKSSISGFTLFSLGGVGGGGQGLNGHVRNNFWPNQLLKI